MGTHRSVSKLIQFLSSNTSFIGPANNAIFAPLTSVSPLAVFVNIVNLYTLFNHLIVLRYLQTFLWNLLYGEEKLPFKPLPTDEQLETLV